MIGQDNIVGTRGVGRRFSLPSPQLLSLLALVLHPLTIRDEPQTFCFFISPPLIMSPSDVPVIRKDTVEGESSFCSGHCSVSSSRRQCHTTGDLFNLPSHSAFRYMCAVACRFLHPSIIIILAELLSRPGKLLNSYKKVSATQSNQSVVHFGDVRWVFLLSFPSLLVLTSFFFTLLALAFVICRCCL
jgi:hypothetical protein